MAGAAAGGLGVGLGVGAGVGLGNVMQFNVVEHGVLEIQNPIEITDALLAEAVLDANPLTEACDVIKATVDVPLMTDERYAAFMRTLVRERFRVTFDYPGRITGHATDLINIKRQLLANDLDGQTYNFVLHLLGEDRRYMRQMLGADPWFNVQGILSISNPWWDSISTPQFSFFGTGAKEPLCYENHKFGLFYYVGKGRQEFHVIPRAFGPDAFRDDIVRYLSTTTFPRGDLQCANLLQHFNLYFDPNFLRSRYDAKTVVLTAGQCLFIHSETYLQINTLEPGFAVSFACLPNRWITIANNGGAGECVHVATPFTPDVLDGIKEKAIQVKNYAVQRMRLNGGGANNAGIQFIPPIFPRRIASLHNPTNRRGIAAGGIPQIAAPGNVVPGNAVQGNAVPGNAVPGNAVPGNAVPGPSRHVTGQQERSQEDEPVLQQFPDEEDDDNE